MTDHEMFLWEEAQFHRQMALNRQMLSVCCGLMALALYLNAVLPATTLSLIFRLPGDSQSAVAFALLWRTLQFGSALVAIVLLARAPHKQEPQLRQEAKEQSEAKVRTGLFRSAGMIGFQDANGTAAGWMMFAFLITAAHLLIWVVAAGRL